jgi:hypothetical protein
VDVKPYFPDPFVDEKSYNKKVVQQAKKHFFFYGIIGL